VQRWLDGLCVLPGVTVERGYPSEAGQPHARAIVRLGAGCRLNRAELIATLWDGDPRVAVGVVEPDAIALNPQTLEPGEAELVLETLRRLLAP
jgi:L-seryl-tRNA(Ser) seleniumtransferase